MRTFFDLDRARLRWVRNSHAMTPLALVRGAGSRRVGVNPDLRVLDGGEGESNITIIKCTHLCIDRLKHQHVEDLDYLSDPIKHIPREKDNRNIIL